MSKKYIGQCLKKNCSDRDSKVCTNSLDYFGDKLLELIIELKPVVKCPKGERFVKFEIIKNHT